MKDSLSKERMHELVQRDLDDFNFSCMSDWEIKKYFLKNKENLMLRSKTLQNSNNGDSK